MQNHYVSQAYTDNLIANGKVDKAALYSRAGDALWAQSGSFELQQPEITEIAKGFDSAEGLQTSGLRSRPKVLLLRADDRSIYGKHEAEGVICVELNKLF